MTLKEFELTYGPIEKVLSTCKNERAFGGSCNCLGCRLKRQMADPSEAHKPESPYAKQRMTEAPSACYVMYKEFLLWIA